MVERADPWPPGKVLPVMALTPGLLSAGRAWQGETCIAPLNLLPIPAAAAQTPTHRSCVRAGAPASIPGASAPSGVHAGEFSSGEKSYGSGPFGASVTA